MNADEEDEKPSPQQIVDKYQPVKLVPIENKNEGED